MVTFLQKIGPAILFQVCLFRPSAAAELKQPTVQAFDEYVHGVEARFAKRVSGEEGFLWADDLPARRQQLVKGEIVIEPVPSSQRVPDGLIHDWLGAIFIPGATLAGTLSMVQNYDNHKNIYQPEVVDSKTLSRSGDEFRIYLRLLKKKVLTVVLNTQHLVRYTPLDSKRCYSRSFTTRIAEVEDAGKPDERELPPGTGHGFLWKLNSYWKFQERDGGVYVECEAVSLTRNVPAGLGWLIDPFVRNLPRESLTNTLRATRSALAK